MNLKSFLSALAFLLLQTPALAGVPASVWPGASPCNATLQACVDATPNGGAVVIVTDAPIGEDLNLYNRSLSIEAGDGYHPNFAAGRWISATTAPIAGTTSVALSGLRLRGLELNQDDGEAPAYIRVEANAGTVAATLYDNRVAGVPRDLNSGLIELVGSGATLNANVYHNHVTRTSAAAGDGSGINVDQHFGAAGTIKLHANEVRGRFNRAGIWISEGLFSSTASNFTVRLYNNVSVCNGGAPADGGSGIGFAVNNGGINAQAVNNTVSRCYYGLLATQWSGATLPSAHIDGLIDNNLLVATSALSLLPSVASAVTNDYNLINGGSNVAFGAHTLTAPAQLVSDTNPRLRNTSPAIGAADGATLVFGLIFNTLPTVDADGLRRIKGTDSNPDIGAYEFGDFDFLHTVTSANAPGGSYITAINNVLVNAIPTVNVISTPNFNVGGASPGVSNNQAIGIYYFSNVWRLFNENSTTAMPIGAHFNNFSPAAGGGSFRHVSSAANSSGFSTRLDDSSVNNLPERIVLATQNWSAGSGIYNAHPIGVSYTAGSPGYWSVSNLDQVGGDGMPVNAGFNIYAQEASPNAFRVTSGNSNSVGIDHPLLNGVSCAQIHATRIQAATAVPSNYDLYYTSDRWRIYSYPVMPAGTQFNIVIDPAQIAECTDRIYADGFQ